jgi:hypothetical protein
MKNEKIKRILEKVKNSVKSIIKYSVITLAIISSFYLGKFIESQKISEEIIDSKVTTIKRSDVNIAIDEGNNLLIIDNKTGDYMMLQDSIGNSIFKLYSRNIWAQHSVNE